MLENKNKGRGKKEKNKTNKIIESRLASLDENLLRLFRCGQKKKKKKGKWGKKLGV